MISALKDGSPGGGVGVLDVAQDLRRREERVELRLARERLREVDHAAGHRCSFRPKASCERV